MTEWLTCYVPLGLAGSEARFTVGDVEISLSYDAGGSSSGGLSREILASKFQSDLQQTKGLWVKLNPMDPTLRLADYRAGRLLFVMSSWAPDYAIVHSYTEPFGHTGGEAAKRVGFSNAQSDALIDQGIVETDPAKRTDLYTQVQEFMFDEVPFIVEFQLTYRFPAVQAVQNVTPQGIIIMRLRYSSKTAEQVTPGERGAFSRLRHPLEHHHGSLAIHPEAVSHAAVGAAAGQLRHLPARPCCAWIPGRYDSQRALGR